MSVRRMLPDELGAAVSVWRAANVARGAPHGAERTARVRAKLSAPDDRAFVALRPEIVGVALAEPGRLDDGAGELVGMAATGKTARVLTRTQVQYGCLLSGPGRVPRAAGGPG